MKKIIYTFLVMLLTVSSSCELDGLQQDPNFLTRDQANPDFVLNAIALATRDWFFELTDPTMEVTRMIAAEPIGNQYFTYLQPQNFNNLWELSYTSILADAQILIDLAEPEELFVHAGIARVMRAYVLMCLVDFFGDVPSSQALDPENLTPMPDSGADVYDEAESLLNEAIANFEAESAAVPTGELFYGGDADQWIALANTLKLRLYLTTRLVKDNAASQIGALIAEDNFIRGSSHWALQHGTNAAAPDSRHEYYIDNYPTGATDYMSNYYMWSMRSDKPVIDPRIRYYFYRQTLVNTRDVNEQDCISIPRPRHYPDDSPFCNDFLGNGYWGRDHLDTDGIPPDNLLRTNFGVYPAGGKFDANQGTPVRAGDGLGGAGIHPLMMTFYVDFMLAEAALTLGTPGDPRALLESAVRGSINTVINFGTPAVTEEFYVPSRADINAYVDVVLENYDNSTDPLDVIATEYYLALFGNGIEAYNLYRRTGSPQNIQLPLNENAGPFIRSFYYPAVAANQNQNINQKGESGTLEERVFWDTGETVLR